MQDIRLDASSWRTWTDFSAALQGALGSPKWHGGGIDAFIDSMIWGEIDKLDAPYRITIANHRALTPELREEIKLLSAVLADSRAEYFAREGAPREVSLVFD